LISLLSLNDLKILLVTSKTLMRPKFRDVLNRLRTTNWLNRIVFNECHLLLNRDSSFRTIFLQLWKLALIKTQLLFLIVIMSSSRESDFWRALRLASISPTSRTLRTTTTRVNIRYEIRSLLTRESVVLEMRRLIASVSLFNKILVFCTIVDLIESLTQELSSLRYHAKLTNKNEMLRQFDRPKCRTMIAIIALSLELNKQNIDLIVHVDHLFDLLNYAQESGRDGRDERECHVVIVRASAKDSLIMNWSLRQYLWGIGSRPSCRRVTLNHYLDERIDRTQCEKNEHEELCDVCEAKASAPALAPASTSSTSGVNSAFFVAYEAQQHWRNQIRMLALNASKQKTLTYEKQLRALKTLQDRCLLCDYLQGALHFIDECRSVNRAAYDAIKAWI
jgi:superfamily II DNA helicase RecQ